MFGSSLKLRMMMMMVSTMACLGSAVAKDTLTLGLPVEPTGLDPTISAPVAIREVTWGNVFEGLVTLDEEGEVQPLLATAWDVSEDGLTYTFRLRDGVRFHNGTPFDSSIVKFSLDRARAEDSTNAQKQFFEPIASIDTPDPLTAVVHLKQPTGLFVYHLAWGDAVMVDPATVDANRTEPVGTGPFKFKSWQRGIRVELVRNDDYWDAGVPRLAAVTFRFIDDAQAQASALRAGDVDGVYRFTAPELFDAFQKDDRFNAVAGLSPAKIVAGMNNARAPFDQPKVRQAMMSAIDRQAVIDAAYSGHGVPIGSHYAPTDPGYVDLTDVWPYDPDKARALLQEAGHADGFKASMKCPQMSYVMRTCEMVQAFLAEVGIQLKIETSEFPAKWIEDVFIGHNFEVTAVNHAEPMDIDIYSRPNYYFQYKNPQFNALIAQAGATVDEDERNALYAKAQEILAEQVPALYIFGMPQLSILDARLKGMWENAPISEAYVRDAYWED